MLTQAQNEALMVATGYAQAKKTIEEMERTGNAHKNPYAMHIFRAYVEPLARTIAYELEKPLAGRAKAHVALLKPLDPWAIAYLTVRVVLNGGDDPRRLGYTVGKMIHGELYLTQFKDLAPDLHYTLMQDLGRKRSQDLEHRLAVFKASARANGINMLEWNIGSREQVGLWLISQLELVGMIKVSTDRHMVNGKLLPGAVTLSDEAHAAVTQITESIAELSPALRPCVAPPLDWVAVNDGGWHTQDMRRVKPLCVKASAVARDMLKKHDMPGILHTINVLQRTQWQVNTRVLDAVIAVIQSGPLGARLMPTEQPRPSMPEWLPRHEKGAPLTPLQDEEFSAWKGRMVEWYASTKKARSQARGFSGTITQAREFRDYPGLWFVWFADSRGRFYPMASGLSPQGSDPQKALLHFAGGDQLETQEQVDWFLIHGANKYGFDTEPLPVRAKWWEDKEHMLLAFADDPVNNSEWLDADNPLQFLAWCFEFADYRRDPANFRTHLPVSMDGTCNGLQNYSAMLRDEVGGRATNLTALEQRQDIYKMVADEAVVSLRKAQQPSEDEQWWLAHGMSRSVPKRAVMTTPYGVTKRSATEYVKSDYLQGAAGAMPSQFQGLAEAAMHHVWPAIGRVVVKAREGMDWLKAAAKLASKRCPEAVISWVTPSGFLATQAYREVQEHRINTQLAGYAKIKVLSETCRPAVMRHSTALAPNFIHSLDAAHLSLTVQRLDREVPGIQVAMIHDDYGVTAKYAPLLYRAVREEFVNMYERHDPLKEFAERYDITLELPSKGNLDLREVLKSPHFFS